MIHRAPGRPRLEAALGTGRRFRCVTAPRARASPDFEGARPFELSLRDAIDVAISRFPTCAVGPRSWRSLTIPGLSSSVRAHLGAQREGFSAAYPPFAKCRSRRPTSAHGHRRAWRVPFGGSFGPEWGMRGIHGSDPDLLVNSHYAAGGEARWCSTWIEYMACRVLLVDPDLDALGELSAALRVTGSRSRSP